MASHLGEWNPVNYWRWFFPLEFQWHWVSLDGNLGPLILAQSSQESLLSIFTLYIYSKIFYHPKQGLAYLFPIHKKKSSD